MKREDDFNIQDSPLKEAYLLLSASYPGELDTRYLEEDQKLMKSAEWDYKNKAHLIHKVKDILEGVDPAKLADEEQYWRRNILWFWYHHAVSCAVWRYADRQKAQEYAKKALHYQPKSHPNKITKLLYFLVHDRLSSAERWAETITTEPEKTTAQAILEEYRTKGFFT